MAREVLRRLSEFEQNAVSSLVWPWQAEPAGAVLPDRSRTARAALLRFGILLGIAALFHWALAWHHMAAVALGMGLLLLLSGLLFPRVFRGIEKIFQVFGHGVGRALAWLLLIPFFYLVFLPGRLVLSLKASDPLTRKPDPGAASYWTAHAPHTREDTYAKQY